uniref:Integrase catalytic domain-containing protein n=1 Tax=Strongyloides venezuelensis TaxID=75913 RepID=A0A0K0FHG6_STRVS
MADTKAKTIIEVLRKRIFSIFNTPESIRVDNAHYFDCEEFTFAMSTEDVIINFSTPYYSKSSCLVGKSFATTQNLVSKLLLSIDKSTTMWDQVVDYVVRYYNASVHETLNKSPNFIVFLRDPHHLGWIESTDVKNYGEYVDIGLELMKTAYEIINQHRLRVRMKSKIEEDMKRNLPQLINAGDPILVQLPTPNKFKGLYKGPFICKKVENNIVHYSRGTRKNQTFKAHITKVKKFEETSE